MSEVQNDSSQPTGQQPDQSLLPPAGTESTSAPMPYWAPPPPAPARPVDNNLWHRLAAGVVLAAVIAAAAGAGLGWSLARTINSHTPTAQTITTPSTTQPQTNPEAPLQPANP